ncbi:MAG: hypothetical protein ABI818_18270 [Acidobacteriota bacterium]
MEAGLLEVAAHLGERRAGGIGQGDSAPGDGTVHIEHAEPDRFHVEGPDRDGKRRALLEKLVECLCGRLGLHVGDESPQAFFGGLSMFGIGWHKVGINLISAAADVNRSAFGHRQRIDDA